MFFILFEQNVQRVVRSQVPQYAGICRVKLMAVIAEKLHSVRAGFSLRAAKAALKGADCKIVWWTKCEQRTEGRREAFWAAPESEHYAERFDIVEESSHGLWHFDQSNPPRRRRPPCRNVIQLRGFVHVVVGDGGSPGELMLALGRNLRPHDAVEVICPGGNPIHPMLSITHCLWQFHRCVCCSCSIIIILVCSNKFGSCVLEIVRFLCVIIVRTTF